MDPQTTKELQYQTVHLHDNKSSRVYATSSIMIFLTSVAIVLRLYCRRKLRVRIGPDDFAILIALVLSYGLCVELILTARFGMGRHLMAVTPTDFVRFSTVEWSIQFTYIALVTTIKISILLFYRRLFPNSATNASFRVAWVIVAFLSVGLGIGTFVAAICNCKPLEYYLNPGDLPRNCQNLRSLLVSTAAINALTDVSILVLPIMIVWRLQITKSQKLAVSGIFLLGGFVCVVSIVRILYLSRVRYTDSTWTDVDTFIWSTVEPCIGIVSACLPVMRPILQKIVPSSVSSIGQPPKAENLSRIINHPVANSRGQTVEVYGDLERLNGIQATTISLESQHSSQKEPSSDKEMAFPTNDSRHNDYRF